MKLVRFGLAGMERPGLIDGAGHIRDLLGHVPDICGDVLSDAGLERLRRIDPASLPRAPEGVRIGPCVGGVGKFVGVGLNYADHADEMGLARGREPVFFLKATSSLSGPNDPIELPRGGEKTDWEVELGVVIGKRGKYIAPDQAINHVAGFCVVNDVTERAFQLEHHGAQWSRGKSCDTFGPVGPWLVTRDEVPDYRSLHIWLDVDGVRTQDSSTAQMIYGVPEIISYISSFMTLDPGDIITTGSPAGAGKAQKPEPRFLKAGNRMRLGIAGLGVQEQYVMAAQ